MKMILYTYIATGHKTLSSVEQHGESTDSIGWDCVRDYE